FQGVIAVGVSAIVLFLSINVASGFKNITESLQSAVPMLTSSFATDPIISIACWIFLFSLGAAGQPHFVNKFLMIKSQKELKWGAFTASLAYALDRKSTRLNSSHVSISYAVFCLKKKKRK